MILTATYLAIKQHKQQQEIKENREKANSKQKTNEEIAEELFIDTKFNKLLKDNCITVKGIEKEIRKELKKRKFDLEKSAIEINFEKRKWVSYKVKNFEADP